jgi:hypothetical protein
VVDTTPRKNVYRHGDALANFRPDAKRGYRAADQVRRQELNKLEQVTLTAAASHEMIDQK